MKSSIPRLSQIAILAIALAVTLRAQTPTASILGAVQDASGARITDAVVKVRNSGTGEVRTLVSDGQGQFTAAQLPPGPYEITVEKQGFRALRETGLELQVEQVARVQLEMQVGTISDSLEVQASAPLLNTEDASKGEVVSVQELTEMPLNGRNFSDLAFMVPGVAPIAESGGGYLFNVNGARADTNNNVIDGFNNSNYVKGKTQVDVNLDAMQEFKMQTGNYSAEYGRMGGGVINMALKSGTNRFHGTMFEFLRNDKMDARNFFDADKRQLKRNQFGATLDGPVSIPKLYNGKNRTFFLVSWESYRQVTGQNLIIRVPEARECAGDFSQTLVNGKIAVLKDPLGGNFPGNVIPASRQDAIALKLVPYYPEANRPGQANNSYSSNSRPTSWDSFVYKIDQRIGSGSLSGRVLTRHNPVTKQAINLNTVGTFSNNGVNDGKMVGLSYTHLFGPSLITELRAGYSRSVSSLVPADAGRNYAAELGIPGTTTDPKLGGFPLFSVTGLAALGDSTTSPSADTNNIYQWAGTTTWVKGRHLLKFGGEIIHSQYFSPFYNNNRGTFNFLGNWTTVPFADLLLGLPDNTWRQTGTTPNYLLTSAYGVFVQDDFKVSSKVTLNLGVRYDILKPPLEKYGRASSFIPELGQVIIADNKMVPNLDSLLSQVGLTGRIGLAKDNGLPRTLVNTQYGNVGPRFGMAWRPFGSSRMVVRGGYGMYWTSMATQSGLRQDISDVFPFALSQSFSRVASNPDALTFANPFPDGRGNFSGTTNATGIDVNAPSQYMQSWNLTAEREIGFGAAVEVAYAGSKGTHLARKYDLNQPYYSPAMRLPSGAFPRPYAGFNSINYYWFGGNSSYNSGMITLRKRFAKGLFYRINYTYSKSIDSGSQAWGSGLGGITGVQNSRDIGAERGRSDWDRGHIFTVSGSWEIPLRQKFLRGWQLAGSGRAYTGRPFTLQVSNVNLNLGGANRPDRIAKGTLANPTSDAWYDVSAFPQVPAGSYRYGTSGRNVLDGPGTISINTSLYKNFSLSEAGKMQVRWEVFNVMNHASLQLPNVNVNQANAATITAAGDGRTMQVALRWTF